MSDHTFDIGLITKVSDHLDCFETHLNAAESCVVPEHSAFARAHVYRMLEKEMGLPVELRVYLSWKRDKIRSMGTWTWFAPKRIFQMHHESLYIIGQQHQMASPAPSGFVMYDPENRVYIVKTGTKKRRYSTLTEVIVQISKNR